MRGDTAFVATMRDLDELALALPQTTKRLSGDGRPEYYVHEKLFCCHRGRRKDALDPESGERLDDVLMFRVADLDVKELLLADDRGLSSRRRTSTATRPCSFGSGISRESIAKSSETSSRKPGSRAHINASRRRGSRRTK